MLFRMLQPLILTPEGDNRSALDPLVQRSTNFPVAPKKYVMHDQQESVESYLRMANFQKARFLCDAAHSS